MAIIQHKDLYSYSCSLALIWHYKVTWAQLVLLLSYPSRDCIAHLLIWKSFSVLSFENTLPLKLLLLPSCSSHLSKGVLITFVWSKKNLQGDFLEHRSKYRLPSCGWILYCAQDTFGNLVDDITIRTAKWIHSTQFSLPACNYNLGCSPVEKYWNNHV